MSVSTASRACSFLRSTYSSRIVYVGVIEVAVVEGKHCAVREWRCSSTIFLPWAVRFTPRPSYFRGKSPRYPFHRRLLGPQSQSGLLPGIDPCPSSTQSFPIPGELTWLLYAGETGMVFVGFINQGLTVTTLGASTYPLFVTLSLAVL
jgi:hypothetical protein